MTSFRFPLLASTLLISVAAAVPAPAQINENRVYMERLDRLERDINTVQKQLGRRGYDAATLDADTDPAVMGVGNIGGLEEELRKLRGQIEENQFEIKNLRSALERMQKDVDLRLNTLEQAPMQAPAAAPAPEPQAGLGETLTDESVSQRKPVNLSVTDTQTNLTQQSDGEPTAATSEIPGAKKNFESPRDLYNHAFRMLNQTNYDESAKYFEQFISQYPKDPLIGNAYYWLGETYYIKRDYIKAADGFRQGFEALPNGPKAPDNLLKLAMTLRALNRNEDACTVLGQLTVKFKDASTTLLQKAEQERNKLGCI